MPADVSSSLPQLDLEEGTVVTVTLDDPAAVVASLAVHGWQDNPGGPETLEVEPLWLPLPAGAP